MLRKFTPFISRREKAVNFCFIAENNFKGKEKTT
jgi:hypothetical protein